MQLYPSLVPFIPFLDTGSCRTANWLAKGKDNMAFSAYIRALNHLCKGIWRLSNGLTITFSVFQKQLGLQNDPELFPSGLAVRGLMALFNHTLDDAAFRHHRIVGKDSLAAIDLSRRNIAGTSAETEGIGVSHSYFPINC